MERGDQVLREGLQRASSVPLWERGPSPVRGTTRGSKMKEFGGTEGSGENAPDGRSTPSAGTADVYADRTGFLCVLQLER